MTNPKRQSREGQFQQAALEVLDAVGAAREAYADAQAAYETAKEDIEDALEVLRKYQTQFEEQLACLPDQPENVLLGKQLDAVIDIDLDQGPPDFREPDFSGIENAARACLIADLLLDK